jgi:hypothetical protein
VLGEDSEVGAGTELDAAARIPPGERAA